MISSKRSVLAGKTRRPPPSPPAQDSPTFTGMSNVAQTIPAELLEKIFFFAVGADIDSLDFHEKRLHFSEEKQIMETIPSLSSPNCAPQNVSLVCRNWRVAALGCRHLWNNIQMTEQYARTKDGKRRTIAMAESMIKRSGRLPLTLSASIGYGFEHSGDQPQKIAESTFEDFIRLAANARHRWEKISFISFVRHGDLFDRSSLRKDKLCLELNTFPNLKELVLRIPYFKFFRLFEGPTPLDLSSCTKLETLKLDGRFELVSDGTPLTELRHVDILQHEQFPMEPGLWTMTMAVALARLAPNLVTLKLDILYIDSSPFNVNYTESDVELPFLEELALYTLGKRPEVKSDLEQFIDLLRVPSLRILDLEILEEVNIRSLIKRSGCNIRSLTVNGTRWHRLARRMSWWALTEEYTLPQILLPWWLSLMPDLEELTVIKVDFPPTLLRQLCLLKDPQNKVVEDDDFKRNEIMAINVLEKRDGITTADTVASGSEDREEVEHLGDIVEDDEHEVERYEEPVATDDEVEFVYPECSVDWELEAHDDRCPKLRMLKLQECRLANDYQSAARIFIDMLATRMLTVPGSQGKMEELHVTKSRMHEVSKDKKVLKWQRDYGAKLFFSE